MSERDNRGNFYIYVETDFVNDTVTDILITRSIRQARYNVREKGWIMLSCDPDGNVHWREDEHVSVQLRQRIREKLKEIER